MSSHHIVRDEQEPALAILEKDFDLSTVQNLLEWSPTVITIPNLIETIIPFGFKIDVVMATDVEMEAIKNKLIHQLPIKFIVRNPTDDDILQVIDFLNVGNYNALNVIGNISFETVALIHPFVDKINIVFYHKGFKWYYIKSATFKKWISANSCFKTFDDTLTITQYQVSIPFVQHHDKYEISMKRVS